MTERNTSLGAAVRPPRTMWLPITLLVLWAAFVRLWAIDRLPPGLYHDEAYNGLDALSVLQGHWPVFFEANNGREPLFIYLTAASVGVLGRSPGALRLVSALLGTLTIVALYALGRELFGQRIGLLSAAIASTTVWTLNLSRVAFRAVSMPLVTAIALALLWRGMQRRRLLPAIGAGLVYGLSFYTYLAARFTVIALLLFGIYMLLWFREGFWAVGWLAFSVAGTIALLPLGLYVATHWQDTFIRTAQVSVLNAGVNQGDLWGTLWRNTWRAAAGLVLRGDFIPRHNVPLRPAFDPVMAIAFMGGVGLAVVRARRTAAYGLILIWLGCMLLPTILAEGAPHMLRASGVLTVLFVFPALGLAEAVPLVERWAGSRVALAMTCAILVASAAGNLASYTRHLNSEAAYYNFESAATDLAVAMNRFLGIGWQGSGLRAEQAQSTPNRRAYLDSRLWRDWASVRYLVPDSDAFGVLTDEWEHLPPSQAGDEVLVAVWPFQDNTRYQALLPPGQLISVGLGALERGDLERTARMLYITYRSQPADGLPANADATWEGGIRLRGYTVDPAQQGRLLIRLYWQAQSAVGADYTVFCHVLRDGVILGQHDGQPGEGYYPTSRWRVGDMLEDRHAVPLAAAPEVGSYQVMVGLYRWDTMKRLNLLDEAGKPSQQTTLALQ